MYLLLCNEQGLPYKKVNAAGIQIFLLIYPLVLKNGVSLFFFLFLSHFYLFFFPIMIHKCSFMSFNIRHDHGPSSINSILSAPPPMNELIGEQPWPIRKWKVADTLLFYQPDIVGLQEPVYHQVVDLHILTQEDYDWIGVGRNDGIQEGEYTAIFYKKDLLTVLDWKTIWLSETPEKVGSQGWGAKHPRTATIARFQSKIDVNMQFIVINTHFDHVSEEARQASATLILQQAKQLSQQHQHTPIILLGDLNSTEDQAAYHQLTSSSTPPSDNRTWLHLDQLNDQAAHSFATTTGRPVRTTENSIQLPTHRVFRRERFMAQQEKEEDGGFHDTRYALATRLTLNNNNISHLSGPYGHDLTFTSFGEEEEKENANRRIDYIMYMSPQDSIKVLAYAILNNQFDDGCLISDHRPVFTRLAWS
ncbi:Endonuclease/exonuclease/phosphatase [Halteromyces radiatus]|uniref:Endonuclease/exonuclease/phosphatase n=1 Tax=Halteromyces radiatus TaxID=101107 RepID=UPI00221FA0FB|nr:Endonuclease/exonuclease/phosphatase [Halteromyces radiatus]KAI8089134.1 Endonuclease/exonuclease/phosphatase [Halteromyces radiatus]